METKKRKLAYLPLSSRDTLNVRTDKWRRWATDIPIKKSAKPERNTKDEESGTETSDVSRPPRITQGNESPFLNLVAELRNRIYAFTIDEFGPGQLAPRVYPTGSPNHVVWDEHMWQFIALMQTCKQIRAEFRPIWISNLNVGLINDNLFPFIKTFLPDLQRLAIAPKMIQVSVEPGRTPLVTSRLDLTPLLYIRAHNPMTQFRFVPYAAVGMTSLPGVDICGRCRVKEDVLGERTLGEQCNCDDGGMDFQDFLISEYALMAYINTVDTVLEHENLYWNNHIRHRNLEVYFECKGSRNQMIFTFAPKRSLLQNYTTSAGFNLQCAKALLKGIGLYKIPITEPINVVVSCEFRKVCRKKCKKMCNNSCKSCRFRLTGHTVFDEFFVELLP